MKMACAMFLASLLVGTTTPTHGQATNGVLDSSEPPYSPLEPYPLPLASSVMFEQYGDGDLYKTHFDVPYRQHPCQPRKIHLSPSSDVDPDSNRFNATVSFTLNTGTVKDFNNGEGDLRTTVTYGRGDKIEGSVVIEYDNDIRDNQNTEEYTILRFKYTSPETKEFYESDLIHHVLLKDLEAGRQRYWYRIQVDSFENVWRLHSDLDGSRASLDRDIVSQQRLLRGTNHRSVKIGLGRQATTPERAGRVVLGETPSYEFNTPPLYGHPTSIALVGDLGQTKNSTRTMARILDAAKDMDRHYHFPRSKEDPLVTNLFVAGDLSYADGDPNRWESWLNLAEPLLREVPFASIPGNHEIECDKATRETFVPYESFFRNPNRIGDAFQVPPSEDYVEHNWCTTPSEFLEGHYDYGNAYYSYKQGLVHTIFLNSYTSLQEGSRQRKWLMETALPSVDRSLTPWLVVIFHTPFYTTFLNHMGELNPKVMKESGLQEVFQEYRVNLVVSGHDHAYLRTKPLDPDGKVAANGAAPIYWTLGAGGNREGHAKYINPFWPERWVAKRNNDEFGFGLFSATNGTHAHLQWIRDDDNSNISDGNGNSSCSVVVRDSVWIENYLD